MYRLLPALAVFVLAACQQSPAPDLDGRLYFASGNYVGEFDVAQGTSVIVGNRGGATIHNISEFDQGRLLLAETAVVEGHDVPRISWMDIEIGRAETLYSGVNAIYLPESSALVWDDGSTLHVTGRNRNSYINAEILSHGLNQVSAIVGVSGHMVLFEVGLPEARSIYIYDVNTRELTKHDRLSGICRLIGAVWISDRNQLACPEKRPAGSDSAYLLVDLEGTVQDRPALPDGKQFLALAYAEDLRLLFLTEHWSTLWGAERFAVWSYDFSDGQSYRIVRNQYLGDSAVYVRD